ncbi:MAG: translation initiation factor IF-3 [Alphaproteobacteria bacterium]
MSKRTSPYSGKKRGPRVNEDIIEESIRVVGSEGEMLGVISVAEGLAAAKKAGLDLVEISPNAEPPVCKVLDYGRFKYEAQKKRNESKKKQKTIQVKEVKLRPGIEEHDFQVKTRAVSKFLKQGDKVKITMRFRGRELMYVDQGRLLLERVKEMFIEEIKIEQEPKMEGRQMIMILAPQAGA